MTIVRRAVGRLFGLPGTDLVPVRVRNDLPVRLDDGTELRADLYQPDPLPAGAPVLLTRTPYGRNGDRKLGRIFAERGYQVLVVSCRGTFDSGGDWRPLFNEEADGHAVVDWVTRQDWYTGTIGTIGGSYVGHTQWVLTGDDETPVQAMAPIVTTARFRDIFYPGGTFALETSLTWIYALHHQESSLPRKLWALRKGPRTVVTAADVVPLADSDRSALGVTNDSFQEWLDHPGDGDPYWEPLDFRRDLENLPPVSLVAGWYDLFVTPQVSDFVALNDASQTVRLVVGPWNHMSRGLARSAVRTTLVWMDRHLRGATGGSDDAPVRLYVLGARRWVDHASWPPPSTDTAWHLHPDGHLATQGAPPSAPASYRYDPADPTPAVGGNTLLPTNAGPKDQRPTECRDDVLTFTSGPLPDDLTVVGAPTATVFVLSALDHADLFVRLCDVAPNGRSTNLCDGIVRLGPEILASAEPAKVRIELSPIAVTFRTGHRIRLQVSSGAHPLYARNPGSGEPLGKATELLVNDVGIFGDPEHPSRIDLPVTPTPVRPAGWRRALGR